MSNWWQWYRARPAEVPSVFRQLGAHCWRTHWRTLTGGARRPWKHGTALQALGSPSAAAAVLTQQAAQCSVYWAGAQPQPKPLGLHCRSVCCVLGPMRSRAQRPPARSRPAGRFGSRWGRALGTRWRPLGLAGAASLQGLSQRSSAPRLRPLGTAVRRSGTSHGPLALPLHPQLRVCTDPNMHHAPHGTTTGFAALRHARCPSSPGRGYSYSLYTERVSVLSTHRRTDAEASQHMLVVEIKQLRMLLRS